MRRLSLTLVGALLGSLLWTGVAVAGEPVDTTYHRVTVLTTRLTGEAEVPGPGDPDGWGRAVLRVDTKQGTICYLLVVRRIEPAAAAHIHVGSPDVAGPVVQDLKPPTSGISRGCVANPDLAAAIAEDPENYYVNVHNEPYPAGAIRGNLG